jgi:hypothetical protein
VAASRLRLDDWHLTKKRYHDAILGDGQTSEGGRIHDRSDPIVFGDTKMRFMMLMIPKGYEHAAPAALPDAQAVATMMKYNETLQKAGVLLALDGLHPPSMGARVSFEGGKPKVIDGPVTDAKEVIGGYWMIQVKSKEEAVEWASRCPGSANEVIEVRQVQEFSDFPADVQKAAAYFPEMQAQQAGRSSGT